MATTKKLLISLHDKTYGEHTVPADGTTIGQFLKSEIIDKNAHARISTEDDANVWVCFFL